MIRGFSRLGVNRVAKALNGGQHFAEWLSMILILLFAAIISNPTIAGAFFYLGALQLAKDPSLRELPKAEGLAASA
jgi:hypothetical protein